MFFSMSLPKGWDINAGIIILCEMRKKQFSVVRFNTVYKALLKILEHFLEV